MSWKQKVLNIFKEVRFFEKRKRKKKKKKRRKEEKDKENVTCLGPMVE